MNYYKGFVSEFIKSDNCYDETSAKAIVHMLDHEKLFNVIIESSKFELKDILLLEGEHLEIYVKENIDLILNGIYKKSISEGTSALNHITTMIIEQIPKEQKISLTNHKNRKFGELYESTMAGILYSSPDEVDAMSDDYIVIYQLTSILIFELIEAIKNWMKESSSYSEIHKIISKFLLSESSISNKYILEMIELIGLDSFFNNVKSSNSIESRDLKNHYAISEDDVSTLTIENKEDVLLVIHSTTDGQLGAFLTLSESISMPESIFSHQDLSKEIQTAKMFKRGSADDRDFWITIGFLAIKIMSNKFNNFYDIKASSASAASAPSNMR